jgi:ADP-ribose pyrophosphatase YjhB (NUDIX family)
MSRPGHRGGFFFAALRGYNLRMDIPRPESRQPIPPHAKKVYSGAIFSAYEWEQEMFDGSSVTFERLRRPDTVGVFPVLPDGSIVIVKEEQPGFSGSYVSILGGRMEPGEAPDVAALREMREESGFSAKSLELWDAQQPVNKIDWAVYTFIAKGVEKVGEQQLDAGERVELLTVSLDELIELVATGACIVREVQSQFIEAKWNPAKHAELERLFSPAI